VLLSPVSIPLNGGFGTVSKMHKENKLFRKKGKFGFGNGMQMRRKTKFLR
jgi:hypothetical protein